MSDESEASSPAEVSHTYTDRIDELKALLKRMDNMMSGPSVNSQLYYLYTHTGLKEEVKKAIESKW